MLNESKIEILQIGNGLKVPTFEGTYFCSRKDPIKEAQTWLQSHRAVLESNDSVIILGAGAGFHLQLLNNRPNTFAIELHSELLKAWSQYNSEISIPVFGSADRLSGRVLEFRPAWNGNTDKYEILAQKLRGLSKESLLEQAEEKDLWILSEALKNSQWPGKMELNVKDIAQLFTVENQTEEARMWRTLREFVA